MSGPQRDSQLAAPPDGPSRPQVAYLTNLYPATSHSFIRREIQALEAAGWQVHRFSHRGSAEGLADPADEAERARTTILLGTAASMLLAGLVSFVDRPVRTCQAAWLALRMARSGGGRYVAHVGYLLMACELSRQLRRIGCRHVHVHFGTNPADVACLAHRLGDLSYSITCHGPHEFDAGLRLNLGDKIRSAAFVAAVSREGVARLQHAHPACADRVRHVPCGLDAAWFDAGRRHTPTSKDLLCVARLETQKNPLLLLAAARLLLDRGVDFRLTIVGDGSLRDAVCAGIVAQGLAAHVHLVGWQSQQQVTQHLKASRALVLSSRDEGLPVAIMEAFALGLTAIAPDVGGVRELVQTGLTGWLVAPHDPVTLADALQDCLRTSPDVLADMGAVGRSRVAAHDAAVSAAVLAREFRALTS